MPKTIHLVIESGVDPGRQITVTEDGIRVGRSSSNDLGLLDPSMSRFHCRFYIKNGTSLWVNDLGASNQTLVNGNPIVDQVLSLGDMVTVGDSVFQVLNDASGAPPTPTVMTPPIDLSKDSKTENEAPGKTVAMPPTTGSTDGTPDAGAPLLDLGLDKKDAPLSGEGTAEKKKNVTPLIYLALALLIFIVGASVTKSIFKQDPTTKGGSTGTPTERKKSLLPLEITYEKIEAGTSNVFRYAIALNRGAEISAEIDNVKANRHVSDPGRPVEEKNLKAIAIELRDSGFFDLKEEYIGHENRDFHSWRLTITTDRDSHSVYVENITEPREFEAARILVEKFSEDQLEIISFSKTPQELTDLAYDAFLNGQRLYDSRDVDHNNLYNSILRLKEMGNYLDTIDPKPDFFKDAIPLLRTAEEELITRYENERFRAKQAQATKQWRTAMEHYQVIMEMLPESDSRYRAARTEIIVIQPKLKD